MANSVPVRLFFFGKTPELALRSVTTPIFDEKTAQELASKDENVYAIDMTIFASRLKTIGRRSENE